MRLGGYSWNHVRNRDRVFGDYVFGMSEHGGTYCIVVVDLGETSWRTIAGCPWGPRKSETNFQIHKHFLSLLLVRRKPSLYTSVLSKATSRQIWRFFIIRNYSDLVCRWSILSDSRVGQHKRYSKIITIILRKAAKQKDLRSQQFFDRKIGRAITIPCYVWRSAHD